MHCPILCAFCVPIAARLIKFALALDLCGSVRLAGAWNHPAWAQPAGRGIATDELRIGAAARSTMLLPDF
jgi:hypothetical protein